MCHHVDWFHIHFTISTSESPIKRFGKLALPSFCQSVYTTPASKQSDRTGPNSILFRTYWKSVGRPVKTSRPFCKLRLPEGVSKEIVFSSLLSQRYNL